jgi:DNA processing protein
MYSSDELFYLLSLTQIPLVGNYSVKTLVSYCGSAEKVFKITKSKLLKIPGIGELTADSILAFKDFSIAEKELAFIEKHNIKVHIYYDKAFPYRLKNIPDSPVVLFQLGAGDISPERSIGIVGTRRNTHYGKAFTEKLVEKLKPYNCLVVSGLAYGIDIIAHKSCLHNEVSTAAVLAHGLDRIYPPLHANTAKNILKKDGSLISEFLSGTLPNKENFPARNRIVAGLIDVLIVVETDMRGGSMITAKLASGYDREVMALPGKVDEERSKGCNYLIKSNQASMIEGIDDIVKLMGWDLKTNKQERQIALPLDLSSDQKKVYEKIKESGSCELDALITEMEMNSSKLAFILLELEFKSLVNALPGKVYSVV